MTDNATEQIPVVAVVLTHARPRLATLVVRSLIDDEEMDPGQVVLVINGEGGLEDDALQRHLKTVRLAENTGPAGGFAAGIRFFLDNYDLPWLYLSEDDVSLFDLPRPRLRRLVTRAEEWADRHPVAQLGGVVAYGRDLNSLTGISTVHHPASQDGFEPIDVAPWGASLISRDVLEAGVSPNTEWFFGYEDFDFWLQLQAAGYSLLLDSAAAQVTTREAFGKGREASFEGQRPGDAAEPWRAYYIARNFVHLARQHGRWTWIAWHLAKSVRRWQLASTKDERRAVLVGLRAGFRGVVGRNDSYVRSLAELPTQPY